MFGRAFVNAAWLRSNKERKSSNAVHKSARLAGEWAGENNATERKTAICSLPDRFDLLEPHQATMFRPLFELTLETVSKALPTDFLLSASPQGS